MANMEFQNKEETNMAENLWALLIGVDGYLPNELPGSSFYPSLNGCVRDINRVHEFLTTRLALPDKQILKLTATNTGADKPSEPKEHWPTYENIVAKFKQVTDKAKSGDQVYIHYSGHGGRATTIFPDLKGTNGVDETLVPTDIGNSEARYVRDVEIAHLLKAMVDKGLVVTVVFDSCHSGGATRGQGKAVKRGIEAVDTSTRPATSDVASNDELIASWRAAGGTTRNVKPGSGWLLEPKGYTLLAACRAQESAYEYPADNGEVSGALTYSLLEALQQLSPTLTYKQVHDRILAKVHSQFELQTPMLQGDGNRVVFGVSQLPAENAVTVMQVEEERVLLGVGQAQGVRKSAQFAVYPAATPLNEPDKRLALVEITELGADNSWAKITQKLKGQPIEQGAQAVLIYPGSAKLQRPVVLTEREDVPPNIDQKAALNKVKQALTESASGFIPLAKEGEAAFFQVAVNEKNQYEIWDAAGTVIDNLRPVLEVSDANAAKVVQRLIHLAKYRNAQELSNSDSQSPLAGKLVVELLGKQTDFDPVDPPDPKPFGDSTALKPGEWTFLRIKNNLPPVNGDAEANVLNITILDLQPDWGITQVYPAGAGAFETLDPGIELVLPLQAHLPEGYEQCKDVIKIFATLETTNFRWLELPTLDEPIQSKSATRSATSDPLEQLMMAVTETNPLPMTRNLSLAAYPSKGWSVGQVEIEIKKS